MSRRGGFPGGMGGFGGMNINQLMKEAKNYIKRARDKDSKSPEIAEHFSEISLMEEGKTNVKF